jgi:hypothetical protein
MRINQVFGNNMTEGHDRYLDLSRLSKSITSIDLSHNLLCKPMPLQIDKFLPRLERLVMAHCYGFRRSAVSWLSTLPATCRYINLSHCGIIISVLDKVELPPALQTLIIDEHNGWLLHPTNDKTVKLLDTDFLELLPSSLRHLQLPPITMEGRMPTIVCKSPHVLKGLMDVGIIPSLYVKPDGDAPQRVTRFEPHPLVEHAGQFFHVEQ